MTVNPARPRPTMTRLLLPCSALVLTVLITSLCRAVTGISLGLFIGAVGFTTLIVPALCAGERSIVRRCVIPACATLGTSLVWLSALGDDVPFPQWLACSAALLAYTLALGGACSLLLTVRFNEPLAAGAVTLIGLLWLSWPVWLARALLEPSGDARVAWLVPAHPLFAMNGVLDAFPAWDRQPLAYNTLSVLDQHVAYAMPTSVTWTTLVHAAVAAATIGTCLLIARRRRPAPPSDAP